MSDQTQTDDVQTDDVQTDDVQTDDVQTDDVQTDDVQTDVQEDATADDLRLDEMQDVEGVDETAQQSEAEAPADRASDRDDEDAGDDDGQGDDGQGDDQRVRALEREGDVAADYLEELLDIADLDGDLDMDVDGDRAAVSIVGADLSQLVGQRGEVLDALQELTRLAVYRETGERSRLMLDISGYRSDQRSRLVKLAQECVARARETGERVSLDPMSPFERKVVHDAVAEAGLTSESEGVEPRRFVVILP